MHTRSYTREHKVDRVGESTWEDITISLGRPLSRSAVGFASDSHSVRKVDRPHFVLRRRMAGSSCSSSTVRKGGTRVSRGSARGRIPVSSAEEESQDVPAVFIPILESRGGLNFYCARRCCTPVLDLSLGASNSLLPFVKEGKIKDCFHCTYVFRSRGARRAWRVYEVWCRVMYMKIKEILFRIAVQNFWVQNCINILKDVEAKYV